VLWELCAGAQPQARSRCQEAAARHHGSVRSYVLLNWTQLWKHGNWWRRESLPFSFNTFEPDILEEMIDSVLSCSIYLFVFRHKLDVVSCGRAYKRVQRAICSGFFRHAAKKDPQVCTSVSSLSLLLLLLLLLMLLMMMMLVLLLTLLKSSSSCDT
jgi:hypothetical protein